MNACEEARHDDEENIQSFFLGASYFCTSMSACQMWNSKRKLLPTAFFSLMAKIKCLLGFLVPKFWIFFGGKRPHFCVRFQILVYNKQYQRMLKCFYFHVAILQYLAKLGYRSLPHQRYHKIRKKKKKQDQTVVEWR